MRTDLPRNAAIAARASITAATLAKDTEAELSRRVAQIKSKKIHSMVDAKIDLLQLLTPEQRKKISKLHSKH